MNSRMDSSLFMDKEESINVCNGSQDRPLKEGKRGTLRSCSGLLWRAAFQCCPRVELRRLSAMEFIDHAWLLPGPPSRPCLCCSLVFLS